MGVRGAAGDDTHCWGNEFTRTVMANGGARFGRTTRRTALPTPVAFSSQLAATMAGNVWQWTKDWYAPATHDPTGRLRAAAIPPCAEALS
jgi:formylglycine-generating enzyme required for sulfatase activity